MTPKEKANRLHTLMYGDFSVNMTWTDAKRCALIAVNEIINCDSFFKTLEDTKTFTKYWYDVQQEIEKL